MTAKTLEEEAREAASVYANRCWPQRSSVGDTAEHRSLMSDVHHAGESGYEDGYLAAATLRDKEIEELRVRVKELEELVPRWVKDDHKDEEGRLDALGWLNSGLYEVIGGDGYWLMVQPIPLPGEGG